MRLSQGCRVGSRVSRAARACALLAAVLAAAVAAGCAASSPGEVVPASGQPVTRQYDMTGFTGVKLDSGLIAAVMYDDGYAAAVTVDESVAEYLVAEVDGDTLHIGLQPGKVYSGLTFRVTVTLPQLRALEVTGGARARVYGFASSDPLSLTISGGGIAALSGVEAGDVTADVSGAAGLGGDLKARTLTGAVSGSSRIGVTGSAESAVLDASGGSNLDLGTFTIGDLEVDLSGASRGTVIVTGTLDADVSGGSQLEYGGSPTLGDVNATGGSHIGRMGE